MKSLFVFILFSCIVAFPTKIQAQDKMPEPRDWAERLSDPADKKNMAFEEIWNYLFKKDSSQIFQFINQLEPLSDDLYFKARFLTLKSRFIYYVNIPKPVFFEYNNQKAKAEVKRMMNQAMSYAYELNDDWLTALVSAEYGNFMSIFGESEYGVMYLMNSADLYDKLGYAPRLDNYVVLGEMLWKVREYEACIKYSSLAIQIMDTAQMGYKDLYTMTCSNTIGLAYHRMGEYDSAFVFYNKGLAIEKKITRPVWRAIIQGNMAQIYFVRGNYSTALPLFEQDYRTSRDSGFFDNAANSLQWAARTNLKLGHKDLALQQIREAFILLKAWPQANYQKNAYLTASEIFESKGQDDSAFYYSDLYNKIHDSLEKVIYKSGISIAKLRLNDEKSRYVFNNLQSEKRAQILQRNLLIIGIILITAIGLLLINRQRIKNKFQQQLIKQEKIRIEQEMESAKSQLRMFTENIIEKTNLIEKLEKQVQYQTVSTEDQKLISELSHQTILTEDDWDKFRTLFEKIFPLFFQRLKMKASDITMAEQRMAALTRLQLSSRQMASMLGISTDSVLKSKQRLRKRFGLNTEDNLEEYIGTV